MRSIILIVTTLVFVLIGSGCSTTLHVTHDIERATGRVGNQTFEVGEFVDVKVPWNKSYARVAFRKDGRYIGTAWIYTEFEDAGSEVVITEDMLSFGFGGYGHHSYYGRYGRVPLDDPQNVRTYPSRSNPGYRVGTPSGQYYQILRSRREAHGQMFDY